MAQWDAVLRLAALLTRIAATLWAGALWIVGGAVAPTLFNMLPDRQLAGDVAGRLFTIVTYIGVACGAYLLLYAACKSGREAFRQPVVWVVCVMLALAATGEYAIQPILAAIKAEALPVPVMESALRERFGLWHGVAGAIYMVECAAAIALIALLPKLER